MREKSDVPTPTIALEIIEMFALAAARAERGARVSRCSFNPGSFRGEAQEDPLHERLTRAPRRRSDAAVAVPPPSLYRRRPGEIRSV